MFSEKTGFQILFNVNSQTVELNLLTHQYTEIFSELLCRWCIFRYRLIGAFFSHELIVIERQNYKLKIFILSRKICILTSVFFHKGGTLPYWVFVTFPGKKYINLWNGSGVSNCLVIIVEKHNTLWFLCMWFCKYRIFNFRVAKFVDLKLQIISTVVGEVNANVLHLSKRVSYAVKTFILRASAQPFLHREDVIDFSTPEKSFIVYSNSLHHYFISVIINFRWANKDEKIVHPSHIHM